MPASGIIVPVNPSLAHRRWCAPRTKRSAPDVWIFESRLGIKLQKPLLQRASELVLRPLPFRRSQSDSQLLLFPNQGKG